MGVVPRLLRLLMGNPTIPVVSSQIPSSMVTLPARLSCLSLFADRGRHVQTAGLIECRRGFWRE